MLEEIVKYCIINKVAIIFDSHEECQALYEAFGRFDNTIYGRGILSFFHERQAWVNVNTGISGVSESNFRYSADPSAAYWCSREYIIITVTEFFQLCDENTSILSYIYK